MGDVVIIGAGQAGVALGARLRGLGHQGAITLIGAEPSPPYQRPPLSKAYLLGEITAERLWLRAPEFYAEQAITLRLGQPVTALDPARRCLTLGGETLHYDHLALTTGSSPLRLPAALGGDLAGVYAVRTLADVDAMRGEFRPGRRLVIVGGGYIGLEAAAVAALRGLDVTVLEREARILARVAAPETAAHFRTLHAMHGVKIREGTALAQLIGTQGRVSAAALSDGSEIPADFVIVGIGIRPATALAEAAGLAIDDGIATDAFGRTSAPDVWAAGDCASFPHGAGRLRLESVGNAIDQAEVVAANILGARQPYHATPWFWSDQYDCKLQIAGLNSGYQDVVTRGPEAGAISFWYYRGDQLLAVDAVNDPRAYMVGKRLIEQGKSPNRAAIADPATALKDLLRP